VLSSHEIKEILTATTDAEVAIEDIEGALATIAQSAILQDETNKRRMEVKGYSALSEVYQQMMPCQECYAFLVYVDGALVMFQPHNPSLVAYVPMQKTEASAFGALKLEQMTKDSAASRIVAEVKAALSL